MKILLTLLLTTFISLPAVAQISDPMGLSDYTVWEPTGHQLQNGLYHENRRLTNHEAEILRKTGVIDQDGKVSSDSNMIHYDPAAKVQVKTSKMEKGKSAGQKQVSSSDQPDQGQKKVNSPGHPTHDMATTHYKVEKKPLPSHKEIAKQTKTKHKDHPASYGTVEVRPTNFPENPTRDEIVQMQQDIQHIERQVGRAFGLSLSAYAVAELPQATEGRSGLSVGGATVGGKSAEAIGYSSNFGKQHQYTIKLSLSHAGHANVVGGGFNWQW